MNLLDFYADQVELVRCMEIAAEKLLPLIDQEDDRLSPGGVKISTALFVLLTYRAVKDHGLQVETAQQIVKDLIEAIGEDDLSRLGH